jgi:hypothetical protein
LLRATRKPKTLKTSINFASIFASFSELNIQSTKAFIRLGAGVGSGLVKVAGSSV